MTVHFDLEYHPTLSVLCNRLSCGKEKADYVEGNHTPLVEMAWGSTKV